jgi:hypothetical protein
MVVSVYVRAVGNLIPASSIAHTSVVRFLPVVATMFATRRHPGGVVWAHTNPDARRENQCGARSGTTQGGLLLILAAQVAFVVPCKESGALRRFKWIEK